MSWGCVWQLFERSDCPVRYCLRQTPGSRKISRAEGVRLDDRPEYHSRFVGKRGSGRAGKAGQLKAPEPSSPRLDRDSQWGGTIRCNLKQLRSPFNTVLPVLLKHRGRGPSALPLSVHTLFHKAQSNGSHLGEKKSPRPWRKTEALLLVWSVWKFTLRFRRCQAHRLSLETTHQRAENAGGLAWLGAGLKPPFGWNHGNFEDAANCSPPVRHPIAAVYGFATLATIQMIVGSYDV